MTDLMLITVYLLSSSLALAQTYCESAEKLRNQVNYCHENLAYIEPSQKCRDQFRTAVKEKEAEVQRSLAIVVNEATDNAQKADFETTKAALASAESALAILIQQGKQVHTEVEDFAYDFVLPLYEAFPEDFSLNPDDPKEQEAFRDNECYGIPMDELDIVKKDLQEVIESLEKTQAKVLSLHAQSNLSGANLGTITSARSLAMAKQKAGTDEAGLTLNKANISEASANSGRGKALEDINGQPLSQEYQDLTAELRKTAKTKNEREIASAVLKDEEFFKNSITYTNDSFSQILGSNSKVEAPSLLIQTIFAEPGNAADHQSPVNEFSEANAGKSQKTSSMLFNREQAGAADLFGRVSKYLRSREFQRKYYP